MNILFVEFNWIEGDGESIFNDRINYSYSYSEDL